MKIKIKELCEAKGINTAYQLAKLAELPMPTAYRAFADDIKHFTPETLEKLYKALECSPNDIFGYDVAPVADKPPKQKPLVGFEKIKAIKKQLRVDEKNLKLLIAKLNENDIELLIAQLNERISAVGE